MQTALSGSYFQEELAPSDLVHVVVGTLGLRSYSAAVGGKGSGLISMKTGSMIGDACVVDPARVVPSLAVADGGAVRSRCVIFTRENCGAMARCCYGVAVGPPMFITPMPSITFMISFSPQGLAFEGTQPLALSTLMVTRYWVGLTKSLTVLPPCPLTIPTLMFKSLNGMSDHAIVHARQELVVKRVVGVHAGQVDVWA